MTVRLMEYVADSGWEQWLEMLGHSMVELHRERLVVIYLFLCKAQNKGMMKGCGGVNV